MHQTHRLRQQRAKARQTTIKTNTFLWIGVIFLVSGIGLWLGLGATAKEAADTGVEAAGSPAPAFQLQTLDGADVSLADYKGDVVVINFWATWCPPCRAEMPGIQTVYETYKADGLTVLAVNAQEDTDTIQAFIQETGFTFPVLPDLYGQAIRAYGVRSFPATFVLDRDGNIDTIHQGQITPEDLEAIVRPLL